MRPLKKMRNIKKGFSTKFTAGSICALKLLSRFVLLFSLAFFSGNAQDQNRSIGNQVLKTTSIAVESVHKQLQSQKDKWGLSSMEALGELKKTEAALKAAQLKKDCPELTREQDIKKRLPLIFVNVNLKFSLGSQNSRPQDIAYMGFIDFQTILQVEAANSVLKEHGKLEGIKQDIMQKRQELLYNTLTKEQLLNIVKSYRLDQFDPANFESMFERSYDIYQMSGKNWDEIVKTTQKHVTGLNFPKQVAYYAGVTHLLLARYDNLRKRGGPNAPGEILPVQLFANMQNSFMGKANSFLGVCRDMHYAIVKLAYDNGLMNSYTTTYTTPGSWHTNNAYANPDQLAEIAIQNYGHAYFNPLSTGPSALVQSDHIPDVGLVFRMGDALSPHIQTITSDKGNAYMRATNAAPSAYDPFYVNPMSTWGTGVSSQYKRSFLPGNTGEDPKEVSLDGRFSFFHTSMQTPYELTLTGGAYQLGFNVGDIYRADFAVAAAKAERPGVQTPFDEVDGYARMSHHLELPLVRRPQFKLAQVTDLHLQGMVALTNTGENRSIETTADYSIDWDTRLKAAYQIGNLTGESQVSARLVPGPQSTSDWAKIHVPYVNWFSFDNHLKYIFKEEELAGHLLAAAVVRPGTTLERTYTSVRLKAGVETPIFKVNAGIDTPLQATPAFINGSETAVSGEVEMQLKKCEKKGPQKGCLKTSPITDAQLGAEVRVPIPGPGRGPQDLTQPIIGITISGTVY